MSGFEALSMVCSIMQVISFTKEVLTLCKDVYDGRPTTDRQMEENTASIQILLDNMRQCSVSVQQTNSDKEFYAIAEKCSKAAQELQKEMQQITKHCKPGDAIKAMIAGYKSTRHKKKITSLYTLCCQYQKTTKNDAVELQRRDTFNDLSDTMKYFISQLAAGHTEMSNLIIREGIHTRKQIKDSESQVIQSINSAQSAAYSEAKKDRLLRSLKYESMNTRRTELEPAHEATYISIFDSLDVNKEPKGASSSSSAAAWSRFVQWLQSDERVFWIQGKPGAGKSTLMKFLLQHENTQKGVDKWSPNTLILSHFFWKPGNNLQKNFRGLLCSLTHQLLSSEYSAVDHGLSELQLFGDKDSIGDWEISELESVFHSSLIHCKRPVLFLIDGLDEATEIEKILQFLDFLIGLRRVKICLSCRSEDIFLEKFSKYDGFKLNELTRDDMLQLVSAAIPESQRYPSDFLQDLRSLLVQKADGVYLWLILALESVKRGFRNNDEQYEIYLRLSKLPSELENLYADMWGRLGADRDIYEKEAARYFSLIIMNQTFFYTYSHAYSSIFDFRLSTLQFMLLTNDTMKANILNKSYQLPISKIEKRSVDASKIISIRAAGLLVIKDVASGLSGLLPEEFAKRMRADPSELNHSFTRRVDFIHRTLFDFFIESEIGQNILAQSQSHRVDIDLITTTLCQLRVMQNHGIFAGSDTRVGLGSPLHYFLWLLGQIYAQDPISQCPLGTTLLHSFEHLFEAGLLPWDDRLEWYPLPCFEVILIGDPAFDEFIQSRVEDKGESHATYLVREFLFARFVEPTWQLNKNFKEEFLFSLDGDINSADICLYKFPTIVRGFLETPPRAIRPPEIAPYESGLSATIKRLYTSFASRMIRHESMELLIALLERAPNLNQPTSFLVGMASIRGKTCLLCPDLSDILYTMASIEREDEKGILQKNPIEALPYHAYIIAEVNLKHLIEHFFKITPLSAEEEMPLITRARQLTEIESSKPYAKARFYVQLSLKTESSPASMTCYRFINQDIDILADSIIMEPTFEGFAWHGLTSQRILDHLDELERVEFSALSVLADEKLGVCRLEDMGIKPPT
ncbi:hypothetical protein CFAM422_012486 [Trichoderma lentiforme]|uniref:NACHT domain-containing protein n=1 Tax=Trichoderma lentiforme TaxID=1567552 RepID=A0A9P4X3X0_9HYPO|nr:hypothetical protein CFAM422_012486 [Trichoderma lentiforme]